MSRIGKAPITLPKGVTVSQNGNTVTVKGSLGELKQELVEGITIEISDNVIQVKRADDSKDLTAKHGLFRSLLNNAVFGVSTGYTVKQELVGVGYRATANGQVLEMSLGFSHNVVFQLPSEIKVEAAQAKGAPPVITLTSIDKQLVGQVAAKLRSLRKPEPYKGKGIKFVGEQIRRKAGKSAGK